MNSYNVYIEIVGSRASKKLKIEVLGEDRQDAIDGLLDGIIVHACKPIGKEETFSKKPNTSGMPDFFKDFFGGKI